MKKSVIILDDLSEQINFFESFFRERNYNLIAVNNQFDLLNLIQVESPCLILINSNLRDHDSYLVCKKIKLLAKGKDVPVIFINRDDRYFDVDLTFEAGADDYINYPFKLQEVKHRIEQQLTVKTLKDNLEETTKQLHKIIPNYQKLQEALKKANSELNNQKIQENLSILPSRKFLEETLEKEWLRASRQRTSLGDMEGTDISLILAQINDFDLYRQNHEGEIVGSCLLMIAEDLKSKARRPGDLVAHFTADTFAILLPNTDQTGALRVAEIITDHLADLQIPHNYSQISDYLSCSFGIATGIPTQAIEPITLIEVAQDCLGSALSRGVEGAVNIDHF